jgi:general secretion pathway protein G
LARSLAEAKGMTIVELMIVLTIIASIMGVVGFFVFGALDRASTQEARIEINQLGNMVDAYYLSSSPRQLPDSLQDLAEGPQPLTEEVPMDPWGNDYVYKKQSNREFEIYSAGPDGTEGTEDDVFAKEGEDEG